MSSNKRKSDFLGMPFGTAGGRLRKMIMFHLLVRHKENICFKCEKVIESYDELSIEHIQRWEGVSIELYWDLSNIAFSHLKCNRPEINHGGKTQRKIGKPNTAWCMKCKTFLPVQNFQKNKAKWHGLQDWCLGCMKRRIR